jgi:WD repeat-containing protein 35
MKNDRDDLPVLIDAVMEISCVRWSPNGSMFAIGGSVKEKDESRAVV